MTELLIAKARCDQCLTTKNRIVTGRRAAEIIKSCRETDNHFVCHKSDDGQIIHCRGVFEVNGPSKAYRLAHALGIDIVEIDV